MIKNKERSAIRILACLFWTSFMLQINIYAQPDSLIAKLKDMPEDSSKAKEYDNIFNSLIYADPERAKPFADTMLHISLKAEFGFGVWRSMINQGNYFNITGKYDSAMQSYSTTYDYCLERRETKCLFSVLNNMGNIELALGNLSTADSLMRKAREYAIILKDTIKLIESHINMGALLQSGGRYSESINEYLQADQLSDVFSRDRSFYKTFIYSNISSIYAELQDNKKSISYGRNAIPYIRASNNTRALNTVLIQIASNFLTMDRPDSARIYLKRVREEEMMETTRYYYYKNLATLATAEKTDSALHYLQKALKHTNAVGLQIEEAVTHIEIGNYFYRINQFDAAYRHFEEALALYDTLHISKTQAYAEAVKMYLLSSAAKRRSIQHNEIEEYFRLNDSLFAADKLSALSEIESKYQNEKKEQENLNLRQENALHSVRIKAQRAWLTGIGVGFLSLLTVSGLLIIGFRHKRRTNKVLEEKNHQIRTLNREILHRTKNQLDMAANLLYVQRSEAKDMEDFVRIAESESRIRALNSVNSRLSAEDGYAKTNLRETLQEILESNIFSLSANPVALRLDMPDIHLNAERAVIIALIINELSINSLKYAFASTKNAEISLRGMHNGSLQLYYADNGPGPEGNELKGTRMGKTLVQDLLRQLDATYTADHTSAGYAYNITIPIPYE